MHYCFAVFVFEVEEHSQRLTFFREREFKPVLDVIKIVIIYFSVTIIFTGSVFKEVVSVDYLPTIGRRIFDCRFRARIVILMVIVLIITEIYSLPVNSKAACKCRERLNGKHSACSSGCSVQRILYRDQACSGGQWFKIIIIDHRMINIVIHMDFNDICIAGCNIDQFRAIHIGIERCRGIVFTAGPKDFRIQLRFRLPVSDHCLLITSIAFCHFSLCDTSVSALCGLCRGSLLPGCLIRLRFRCDSCSVMILFIVLPVLH